ncbi:DUF6303 family protein [Streptomyces sp. NBC_01012]|uniref:DUF6303 family protein n=1 Tax=Streptomyces sp. NBC_01012 TaxID=2903717 RepID=UPI0038687AAD|nr:DUF6303 family protein [Streptomyces sp. NBC_01012]
MNTLPAQMSNSGGTWHLFVPLMNASVWPAHDWARSAPAPTVAERERALNDLGYESAPGHHWIWTEDSEIYDDPTSSVRLIATVLIAPRVLGGAS